MSNYVDLSSEVTLQNDSPVIVKQLAGLPGGRALDLSKYKNSKDGTDLVRAGHLIVRDTKTNTISPLDVDAQGAYVDVPTTAELIGVLAYGVSKQDPRCAVLTAGQVNGNLLPYKLKEGTKEKLPRIEFLYI